MSSNPSQHLTFAEESSDEESSIQSRSDGGAPLENHDAVSHHGSLADDEDLNEHAIATSSEEESSSEEEDEDETITRPGWVNDNSNPNNWRQDTSHLPSRRGQALYIDEERYYDSPIEGDDPRTRMRGRSRPAPDKVIPGRTPPHPSTIKPSNMTYRNPQDDTSTESSSSSEEQDPIEVDREGDGREPTTSTNFPPPAPPHRSCPPPKPYTYAGDSAEDAAMPTTTAFERRQKRCHAEARAAVRAANLDVPESYLTILGILNRFRSAHAIFPLYRLSMYDEFEPEMDVVFMGHEYSSFNSNRWPDDDVVDRDAMGEYRSDGEGDESDDLGEDVEAIRIVGSSDEE